jgi:hypothetical protein
MLSETLLVHRADGLHRGSAVGVALDLPAALFS